MSTIGHVQIHQAPTTIRLAVAERGHKLHNLWSVWSYKLQKSCLLPSDPALFHFALLESDLRVRSYELEAPSLAIRLNHEVVGTRFDAEVHFKDGTVAWDEVKGDVEAIDDAQQKQLEAQAKLAAAHQVLYRLFTINELKPHTTRVWNCLRMLQVLQAAKEFSVAGARTLVLSRLCGGVASIGELIETGGDDRGITLAAIFGLMLDGSVLGDLESTPLTLATKLYRMEDHHA